MQNLLLTLLRQSGVRQISAFLITILAMVSVYLISFVLKFADDNLMLETLSAPPEKSRALLPTCWSSGSV